MSESQADLRKRGYIGLMGVLFCGITDRGKDLEMLVRKGNLLQRQHLGLMVSWGE